MVVIYHFIKATLIYTVMNSNKVSDKEKPDITGQ